MFAYNAGAPTVPSSLALFVRCTSISFSSTSMYFFITSIISCFISSKKSADTFALSCIKTKCNLSFAVSELSLLFSFFTRLLKKFIIFSNMFYLRMYYFVKKFLTFAKNPSFFPGIVISTFSPNILLAISVYAFPDGAL